MYDFLQISILGIVLAILIVFIRGIRPDFVPIIAVAGVCIILISAVSSISELFGYMKKLLADYSVSNAYVETILKVCGISFVCSFAAETCRDSGAAAVAATVETTGRIFVVSAVMPLAVTLTETVIEMINTNVF